MSSLDVQGCPLQRHLHAFFLGVPDSPIDRGPGALCRPTPRNGSKVHSPSSDPEREPVPGVFWPVIRSRGLKRRKSPWAADANICIFIFKITRNILDDAY